MRKTNPEIAWSATSPDTGAYSAVEQVSGENDLLARLVQLQSRGEGYLEMRQSNHKFPLLTVGFRGDRAIIHSFVDSETTRLLYGDESVHAERQIEVPIMEENGLFTGAFVISSTRLSGIVQEFLRTGSVDKLGEWEEL